MTHSKTYVLPIAMGFITVLAGLSAPQRAFAAQGEGTLAQAPLNLGSQVAPAFIMAVDDSGSMTFETLFPGRDGQAYWDNATAPNGFFSGANVMRTSGDGINPPNDDNGNNNVAYHHVIAYQGSRIDNARVPIPPIPVFGFARSPDLNPSYFNPATVYTPWISAAGTAFPLPSITATRTDPRNAAAPTFNMTADHRDRTDDAEVATLYDDDVDLAAGDFLQAGWQLRNQTNATQTCTTTSTSIVFPASGSGYLTLPADRVINAACTTVRVRRPRQQIPTAHEQYIIPEGATLPAGTWYFIDSSCGNLGTTTFRQNNWTLLTADQVVNNDCEAGIQYFPATFYLRTTTAAPAGFNTAVVPLGSTGGRSLVANACGSGCSLYRYEIKPANYSSTAAYDAAIQNFASWFHFYGNRNRAMLAGMTQSLADVNNMRIGYFRINGYSSINTASDTGNGVAVYPNVVMRDMASPTQKTSLYTDLLLLPASGSTPNRYAVNNIGTQFKRTDALAPIQLACQKNAGMLFTDGYSNQGGPHGNPVQNADGDMGSPFADGHSNTMADLAAQLYLNNLRPGLEAGRVPVPAACPTTGESTDKTLDCRRDLHMNFYGITLGAKGNVYNVDAAATADPYANPPAWVARTNDDPSTVDEIWHAALNSRGKYINAQSPSAITTAMREVLAAVNAGAGPAGSIALTGARVGDASNTVIPEYASENGGTDWYGRLRAEQVTVTAAGAVEFTERWEASEELPAAGSRRILFARPSTSVNPTVNTFVTANVGALSAICSDSLARCTAAEITALGVTNAQAVDFLRGDRSLEGVRLRTRSTVLGDIVNSSPVISAKTDNYGYKSLVGPVAGVFDPYAYTGYLTTKAARRSMVYAGANDGMLHAFDGETGVETFAYIPGSSLSHMGNLLFPYNAALGNDQKFQHRYFVDGPITVSDIRVGSSWRTALVGTGGAGGKGAFGLDVSSPSTFAASNVLWEISGSTAGDPGQRIGHVLGKPVIVPVKSGTGAPVWKAVFGNGFSSTRGKPSLFVVDMATGVTTTIEATEAAGPTTTNGLGSIVLLDRWISDSTTAGFDGYADTAYGGDLHGNIWKFDLRTNVVGNGGLPIFTAAVGTVRQPITGGLEVAAGPGGGVLLYFGTGSFSFENDASDQGVQSLYSVLDSSPATPATKLRTNLAQQTLAASGTGQRTLTSNPVNYVTQSGWFMDLATTDGTDTFLRGERFVGNPRLQSGLIVFPAFEPAGGAGGDPCAVGGTNWLYAFNAVSGASGLSGLRAGAPTGTAAPAGTVGQRLETSGTTPVRDVAVLLLPPPGNVAAGATAAEISAALERTCDLVVSVAGAPPYYLPRACGRQSWRQIR